jgi:hypothetical protein
MQVMPATGKELKVGDITVAEANVHAGMKYMRFMVDRYYKDEPMTPLDKGLFTFASYNAGPARIASLRKEAARRGLGPNRWCHGVELAAADTIGPETAPASPTSTSTTPPTSCSSRRRPSTRRSASRCRRRRRSDAQLLRVIPSASEGSAIGATRRGAAPRSAIIFAFALRPHPHVGR